MKVRTEITATHRTIALETTPPDEALELLQALRLADPTPAAVVLDHLMSGDVAEDSAQSTRR